MGQGAGPACHPIRCICSHSYFFAFHLVCQSSSSGSHSGARKFKRQGHSDKGGGAIVIKGEGP